MHDRLTEGKYERGDGHFATKVSNREIRALREEYWNAPHGKRSKLEVLAQRHGVYRGPFIDGCAEPAAKKQVAPPANWSPRRRHGQTTHAAKLNAW